VVHGLSKKKLKDKNKKSLNKCCYIENLIKKFFSFKYPKLLLVVYLMCKITPAEKFENPWCIEFYVIECEHV
jgi:hypothetical protein